MEPARFEHHPTKMPRLPWTRLREAAAEGRSIEVRGFELGQSTHEAAQLLSFAGYRFEGRVRFHRCVFRSFVDLAEARFDQTLHLTECEFRAGLKLHDAVVKGRCSLRGSTLCDDKNMWLDWRGLRTGADLRVQGVIAAAPIDLANARIGADLRLDGLHVEACGRTKEEVSERALTGETGLSPMAADMAGKALSLHGAKIEGHLLLKKFTLATGVAYRGALLGRRSQRTRLAGQCDMRTRVGGWVIFDNAAVDAGTDRKAIDMDSAEVRGTVHFIGGTRVTGSIDLRASIGGQVAFQDATVDAGKGAIAVSMESAVVGESVFFIDGTRVTGAIDLQARVKGVVRFTEANVDAGIENQAVSMNRATVSGAVLFTGGTRVTGAIDLRASVRGLVAFNGCAVDAGSNSEAISMESATVGGSVFFRAGTRVIGSIDLRASIGGQVAFRDATIDAGKGRKAIDMGSAAVGEAVLFSDGTRINGTIDLRASVEGNVEFYSATVDAGVGGMAIDMNFAKVARSVLVGNGMRITGLIDLRGNVEGQVVFSNAMVDVAAGRTAVDMTAATVGEVVLLCHGTVLGGGLDLSEATLRGGVTTFSNRDQTAFDCPEMATSADRVNRECLIDGDLDLSFATAKQAVVLHGLSVLGRIRARHLKVEGDLHLCGGVVGAPDATKLQEARDWVRKLGRALRAVGRHPEAGEAPDPTFVEFTSEQPDWLARPSPRKRDLGWRSWETDSTPANSAAPAIDLELAQVRGHLWVCGQRVRGEVNATFARVEGDASLDRTLLDGNLVMRDATITGELSAEPVAEGEPAPIVRGTIDGSGGTFESVTIRLGDAVRQGGKLAKAYLFDGATAGTFRVLGYLSRNETELFSVHRLVFKNLELEGFESDAFPWNSTRDEYRLFGFIILAWLPILALAVSSRPSGWIVVAAFALAYAAIAGLVHHGNVLARRRRPNRPVLDFLDATRFSAAFHIDAERWARAQGDDQRADEIFLKRRRGETRLRTGKDQRPGEASDKTPPRTQHPFVWFWREIVLDFLFGYGVRPARIINVFCLLWLLNWAVFLPEAAVERPLSFETQAVEAGSAPNPANPAWPGDGGTPGNRDHWGPQRAFFMAMRVQVPPVELFLDAEWKPADRAMFGGGVEGKGIALTYENYAAIMRILNLILVPVIIAGATGLLKPREAQYTGAS